MVLIKNYHLLICHKGSRRHNLDVIIIAIIVHFLEMSPNNKLVITAYTVKTIPIPALKNIVWLVGLPLK